MADRDFDLRILKAGSYYLTDVRSPDGEEANHAFELPISPERLDELFRGLGHPRRTTRGGGSPEVRQARDFGRQLFETVFAGEIRDVFQRSLGRMEARGGDLRIRLRLGRDVPELLDLPWELLFDRGRNRFLALEPHTTLVRHLPVQQRLEPMRVAPPLHVLVAISNPARAGCPALDVEQEWANLEQALRALAARGRVSLTRLDGVTQESLRQALRRDACHVLHYIGHGGYDSAAETGLLVLEDKDGGARSCGASRLTFLLREQPALRLVVLNACEGGRSSRTDPFAGVAQSLVQGAIPAVVAMQFPVTDAAAVVLASAFYEALASGRPVDLALATARREVNLRGEEGEIEWATPVLYMRGDGDLFSFEEREPVQPEPTSVAPRTPTPPPGTGAAPTAEHGREPKAEPAKTQPEEAGKKPSQEPPPSLWKVAGPMIVLGALVLGFILIYTPRQKNDTTPAAGPVADTTVTRPASTPVAVPTAPEGERKVLINGPKPLHAGYKTGDVFQECDRCPEMVAIVPDRQFTIGSPENEEGHDTNEKQFGPIDFARPYSLGRYEVTRAQFAQSGVRPEAGCFSWTGSEWDRVASANWEKPGFAQTGKHPAVCVNWDDAAQYLKWLNGLVGNAGDGIYRLPSEVEWEFAARGGNYPAEQYPRF